MKNNKKQSIIQLLLFVGILLFVNILANQFYTKIDLTEDKRFTLTKPTQGLLKSVDEVVYVRVLLDGDFPAGFKRLQKATIEMLDDFRSESSNIQYVVENPIAGSVEENNAVKEELRKDRITPTMVRFKDANERTEQEIYPWAIFYYRGREMAVNLLEKQRGMSALEAEITLNNSISLLEYKFSNAISKLGTQQKRSIAFVEGHGELTAKQTVSLEQDLIPFYKTGRINLDSFVRIAPTVEVLIIAKPRTAFSEKDKFKIDQYVMNGGKVLWMIDRLSAQLDSMQHGPFYLPFDYPINLEDQLFRYGVKIEPNLVLDLECSKIPQIIGEQGGRPQIDLFGWYYHPTVAPVSDHPIVKSLDRVNLFFPSSIDTTVRTKTNITKTVLLQSSRYTRTQFAPVRLNFEILRYEPNPDKFNKPSEPTAVLLEGTFPSLYENRVPSETLEMMKQLKQEYLTRSKTTRMIVVSDGDVGKNLQVTNSDEFHPLGYNQYEKKIYANKQFLLNAIEYLMDGKGVIEARGKDVKLRLLDAVQAKAEKTKWRVINIFLPLVMLLLFGLIFNFIRRKKFAK